jgi:hypothetical protein
MTMADAECAPEKAKASEDPKATRYSPVSTSPSAIVMVTGPLPRPVRVNETWIGPKLFAASLSGKVSAVSAQAETKQLNANIKVMRRNIM